MRFHQLSLRGISEAFRERVNVDLESLGPGLIAIVGENGAGKSTLIGSIFAALFRQLPGQKRPLYDFCTHPEPEIDLTFSVNGERYRSLLKLDPKNRQMESYIFDNKGVALVSGKKEPFQEFIRKRVGTMEYFLASPYSSQKRTGNFLTLERSQRKELFITQLLGLDRLRLISATAKGLADETRKQVLTLEGERKGIAQAFEASSEMGDPAELSRQLEDLAERLRVSVTSLATSSSSRATRWSSTRRRTRSNWRSNPSRSSRLGNCGRRWKRWTSQNSSVYWGLRTHSAP